MARIRTIKPEFFRHYELFQAERDTKLPLRVAFAGLWTSSDRRGRFRWVPEELKLDCLPYDSVDFSRVLDALTTRGFVVKYASAGVDYGWIPGFERHQVINHRERDSILPDPPPEQTLTRAPRVDDACPTRPGQTRGEGKGREGNKEGKENMVRSAVAFGPDLTFSVPDDLMEKWKEAYPAIDVSQELKKASAWAQANPTRRKKNWAAFLVRWMAKAQEWGPRTRGNSAEDPLQKFIRGEV